MREGSPAPGCDRARGAVVQAVDMEGVGDHGAYVLLATLVVEGGGATFGDNLALYLGQASIGLPNEPGRRLPHLMLRKGQQFLRTGSPKVLSISLPGKNLFEGNSLNQGLFKLVNQFPSCRAIVRFTDNELSVVDPYP
jgi:hypothetical protein